MQFCLNEIITNKKKKLKFFAYIAESDNIVRILNWIDLNSMCAV